MRNWLIIANGKVLAVIQKEGGIQVGDYEGYYDTVAEDPSGMFKQGDSYTMEQWEQYNTHYASGSIQSISMRQCRLQLIKMGLDDTVEAAIDSMEDPLQRKFARTEWEYSTTVQRHNGWVEAISTSLGLTSEQLDQMFIEASVL